MIKILFVFGTRPEAIKMAPVIQELKTESSKFKVVVCVTAQHREMLDQVLELFSIMPDYDLDIMTKRQSLPNLTARVLIDVTRIMENENPDIVFVQGDTTTTFAAAQAAFYLKIPVAHIEAGLRTGNRYSPFPEEINRRLTSVMTDFHFAPTKGAEKNLILEGVEKSSIFITGNTGIDALMAVVRRQKTEDRSQKSEVRKGMMEKYFRERWNIALTADTDKSKLILVTGHRRESFGKGFQRICKALRMLAGDNPDIQIVYPVHLNPNVKEPVYSILGDMNNIHLISPLDYEPFVFLMSRSYLILTDSGGIQEEAPSLGVPVLVMRDTTERPDGIEAGSAKLVGTDTEKIITETQKLLNDKIEYDRMSKTINPYGDGQASKRIVRIISEHFRHPIK
ncbi:UDP-N-acetylglucosamine 2-epimerase (non-hydrolyzing) [Thermodesulfovibrionales bacterium]|nr:UDP-N-acetylglucosamine 2-epimerase (non-hydrolyzing) [Thermodesulfovibrionales bacterium]